MVVARQHHTFWSRELQEWPPENVLIQPQNRGTGVGLLLGLLTVLQRDPRGRLLVFPSDHHVDDEEALRERTERAVEQAERKDARPTLLAVLPERTEAGLGWIVPGNPLGPHARRVIRFVEKPSLPVARRLASRGALVNSMIFAADGATLLRLFGETVPETVASLRHQFGAGNGSVRELAALYDTLPPCDLSRDVLEQHADCLAVVPLRPCGWTDLGTPVRLARFLEQNRSPAERFPPSVDYAAGVQGRI